MAFGHIIKSIRIYSMDFLGQQYTFYTFAQGSKLREWKVSEIYNYLGGMIVNIYVSHITDNYVAVVTLYLA